MDQRAALVPGVFEKLRAEEHQLFSVWKVFHNLNASSVEMSRRRPGAAKQMLGVR
ncbi:MAG TPA: hypothetical protein VGN86_17145 [Pyrinomonadaceae bacterium]|nr:hypothetical protein [Pyrinomonadaceae bacterium]